MKKDTQSITQTVLLKQIRQDLKSKGYRLRLKRTSEFLSGKILDNEGQHVAGGIGVFTKAFYLEHEDLFKYLASIKGQAYEDGTLQWPIII
jgi:hypothetical protein